MGRAFLGRRGRNKIKRTFLEAPNNPPDTPAPGRDRRPHTPAAGHPYFMIHFLQANKQLKSCEELGGEKAEILQSTILRNIIISCKSALANLKVEQIFKAQNTLYG